MKKSKRLMKAIIAHCVSVLALGVMSTAISEEKTSNQIHNAWLPQSSNDSQEEQLTLITEHALTRKRCSEITEAKLADRSDPANPKFIVTCRYNGNNTINLVYFQNDILTNFANISDSGAELLPLKIRRFVDKECHVALLEQYKDRAPALEKIASSVKQRQIDSYVAFYDYSEQFANATLDFTVTCLVQKGRTTQLEIFAR